MEQAKMGSFIRKMRMRQGLTQRQLAERLGVTDKAVSKWERGLCYPDMELLPPLSDVLKVSAAELLTGEQNRPETPCPSEAFTEAAAETTAAADAFAPSEPSKKRIDARLRAFVVLTASCLLAALTCLICDLAIHQRYTWFPLVLASLVFGWNTCILPIAARKYPVRLALLSLTLWSFPYLLLVSWLIRQPLVWRISIWLVPISAGYIWSAYAIFLKLKNRKWLAAGLVCLLTVPFAAAINATLDRLIHSEESFHDVFCALLIGATCILVDFWRSAKR